jgi:hypothetical protein
LFFSGLHAAAPFYAHSFLSAAAPLHSTPSFSLHHPFKEKRKRHDTHRRHEERSREHSAVLIALCAAAAAAVIAGM